MGRFLLRPVDVCQIPLHQGEAIHWAGAIDLPDFWHPKFEKNHGETTGVISRRFQGEDDKVLILFYTLVNIQKAIENGPVEIVDFPINSMVDLSIAMWQFTRG